MERVGIKRIRIEGIGPNRLRTERVGSESVDIQPIVVEHVAVRAQPHPHLLLDRVDRCDQRTQADVEEIDVRDRQGDVSVDHDAAVEEAVDQVHESNVAGLNRPPQGRVAHGAGSHRAASIDPLTKLYGGHGPVSSTCTSRASYSVASLSTAEWNSAAA